MEKNALYWVVAKKAGNLSVIYFHKVFQSDAQKAGNLRL